MKKPKIFPDIYIDSIYDVDFSALYNEGYRAVIFDVDNTLVPHGAPADDRAKKFFSYLNDCGFKALLLSNNKEPRVKSFSEDVIFSSYMFKAGKPNPKGYLKAVEKMGVKKEETLFVGDQIFTDIMGANYAGIRNIMVKPILKWKEEIQIIAKRFLEFIVLAAYRVYVRAGGETRPVPLQ